MKENNTNCNTQMHLWFIFCHSRILFYWALKHDTMKGFSVGWNACILVDVLALHQEYGPFLGVLGLAAHRPRGVKFAHDIQALRLFLKKWVALAWAFICSMEKVAMQGVFHCNLIRPCTSEFVVEGGQFVQRRSPNLFLDRFARWKNKT